jgi:hypothetical protein
MRHYFEATDTLGSLMLYICDCCSGETIVSDNGYPAGWALMGNYTSERHVCSACKEQQHEDR